MDESSPATKSEETHDVEDQQPERREEAEQRGHREPSDRERRGEPASVRRRPRAETKAEILELERAMLTDLDDTRIQSDQRGARAFHAVMSGLGPIIGILITLAPFLLEGTVFSITEAAIVGITLGIGVLGAFGAYMGSISGQRVTVSAIRMALAGLVVALISLVLPG